MLALLILLLIWVGGGALIGWGVPKLFKSEPPYGVGVDVAASVIAAVALGIPEWLWILDLFGFKGLLRFLAAVGDPLALSLIVLWVLRKVKS